MLAGLAVVVVLALGSVLALGLLEPADRLGPVVAVAATRDGTSGVDVSATVYADDGQASVRLTASGLGADAYQLYAVTTAGEELLLGRLSGASGTGTYAGDVAVPVGDLASFDLREVDGGRTISVTVVQGSSSPG